MKSVLIVSSEMDLHSWVVRWAIRKAGNSSEILETFMSDGFTPVDIEINPDHDGKFASSPIENDIDSIWGRRLFKIAMPANAGENDSFRIREMNTFLRAHVEYLSHVNEIRWINNFSKVNYAENKIFQLKAAADANMDIPYTLFSNKASRIRDFVNRYNEIIIKPYIPYIWEYTKDSSGKGALATLVSKKQIEEISDIDLECCPAIYQTIIEKVADWRVVFIENKIFSYRITQLSNQDIDFRSQLSKQDSLSIECIETPSHLNKKVCDLMKYFQIEFASMDFAEDKNGNLFFLDLNPGGNWLFLDKVGKESLLQNFCSLLTFGKIDERRFDFPTYTDFEEDKDEMSRFTLRHDEIAPVLLDNQSSIRWFDINNDEVKNYFGVKT